MNVVSTNNNEVKSAIFWVKFLDVSVLALCQRKTMFVEISATLLFTIAAEIHARSLANFYRQYADRHMNLKFMRQVSEREGTVRPFVIVKSKLMSDLMSLSCY